MRGRGRHIGLVKRYNSTIAKDEAQKQFLLKVVMRLAAVVKTKTKSELRNKSVISFLQADQGDRKTAVDPDPLHYETTR